MSEIDINVLINICINTFANYHNINTNNINVLNYYDKSIWLNETPLKENEVSTQPLSKCIFIETQSSLGFYNIYMRKNGKGNVFWKKA